MQNNDYYEAYFKIYNHSSKKEVRLEQINTLGKEFDLYKELLLHLLDIYPLSMEEIENQILTISDDSIACLYEEIKFLALYQQFKNNKPKMLVELKIPNGIQSQKNIRKVLKDEEFNTILDFGKDLFNSQYHLYLSSLTLANILNQLELVDESINMLSKLGAWFSENKLINESLNEAKLQFFLQNEQRDEFNQIMNVLPNFKYKNFYQFVSFPMFHWIRYFLLWHLFSLLSFATNIKFAYLWILPFILINLCGYIISIINNKTFLSKAFQMKIITILAAIGCSIILILIQYI